MSRDVKLLKPELQDIIDIFMAKCKLKKLPVLITQTLRTKAEQTEIYAQGRTTPGPIVSWVKYPNSAHCWGIAFDITKNVPGHLYDDPSFFSSCAAIAKSLGLRWGGDWKKKVDSPHFELPIDVSSLISAYGTPSNYINSWNQKEEEEMTQDQFNQMMDNYLNILSEKQPSAWSADARKWAEGKQIIVGDEDGNKNYKKFMTREEYIQMEYRQNDIK